MQAHAGHQVKSLAAYKVSTSVWDTVQMADGIPYPYVCTLRQPRSSTRWRDRHNAVDRCQFQAKHAILDEASCVTVFLAPVARKEGQRPLLTCGRLIDL